MKNRSFNVTFNIAWLNILKKSLLPEDIAVLDLTQRIRENLEEILASIPKHFLEPRTAYIPPEKKLN